MENTITSFTPIYVYSSGQRKLQEALEELRQSESKKRMEALQAEQEKQKLQESSLEQLRKVSRL